MATKGTAWVLRRSVDLVPYLIAMAAKEMWDRRHDDTTLPPDLPPDEEGAIAA
jgi:hypothetical protein